jgi:putative component of toxin-antitoxin plasmid stabilization module
MWRVWGGGVYEYRIDFGPGYRIYLGKDGDQLVILSLVWRDEETPTKRHRACAGLVAGLQTSKDKEVDDGSHSRL